ncbi:MAG: hypothetical protein ACYDHP_07910 [Ferrimicrobium sp.]
MPFLYGNIGVSSSPGLLPGQPILDPNAGFTTYSLGVEGVGRLLHGVIPWWNPYEGIGTPLIGEMQSAVLLPSTALYLLPYGFLLSHIVLEIASGIGMFMLLRQIGLTRLSASCGLIIYELNGTYALIKHAPFNTLVAIPFLFLGIEIIIRSRGKELVRVRGLILVSGSVAWLVLAGFPETLYLVLLLAGIRSLVGALTVISSSWRAKLVTLAILAVGVLVGILLAAPELVAFLDFLPHASVGGHSGAFSNAYYPIQALPQLLYPFIYGSIFAAGSRFAGTPMSSVWLSSYLAIGIVFLAIIGAFFRSGRKLWLVLMISSTVMLVREFHGGDFAAILNVIPGMRDVAFTGYAPPAIWEFSFAVMASFGVEYLIGLANSRRPSIIAATLTLIVSGAVLVPAIALLTAIRGVPGIFATQVLTVGLSVIQVVLIVAIVVTRSGTGGRSRPVLKILLVTLVGIPLVMQFEVPSLSLPTSEKIDSGLITWIQRQPPSDRLLSLGPLAPNFGSALGINEVNFNDLPIPKVTALALPSPVRGSALGGLFIGNEVYQGLLGGAWSGREVSEFVFVMRRWGVGALIVPVLPAASIKKLSEEFGTTFRILYRDPSFEVLRIRGSYPLLSSVTGNCSSEVLTWNSYRVACGKEDTLVWRELYMPGWGARINGGPRVQTVPRGYFQSLRVPAGVSLITLSYVPPYEREAILVSVLALCALLGLGASVLIGTVRVERERRRLRC